MRLAQKIAHSLEAANPIGLVYGEDERSIIEDTIESDSKLQIRAIKKFAAVVVGIANNDRFSKSDKIFLSESVETFISYCLDITNTENELISLNQKANTFLAYVEASDDDNFYFVDIIKKATGMMLTDRDSDRKSRLSDTD